MTATGPQGWNTAWLGGAVQDQGVRFSFATAAAERQKVCKDKKKETKRRNDKVSPGLFHRDRLTTSQSTYFLKKWFHIYMFTLLEVRLLLSWQNNSLFTEHSQSCLKLRPASGNDSCAPWTSLKVNADKHSDKQLHKNTLWYLTNKLDKGLYSSDYARYILAFDRLSNYNCECLGRMFSHCNNPEHTEQLMSKIIQNILNNWSVSRQTNRKMQFFYIYI